MSCATSSARARSGQGTPTSDPRSFLEPGLATSQPARHEPEDQLWRAATAVTEIEAALDEHSRNRGNSILFYGKQDDLSSNRRDEHELSVLCLRILQASLVFINTLMLQDVLTEAEWANQLAAADRAG